jgi:hypothetical protein
MKWLFLIFKLRELKRLHKYNDGRYWGWLKTMDTFEEESDDYYDCYDQAIFHLEQMRKLESQIKLLT